MPAMWINKEESTMGHIVLEFFASKKGILNETETNKPNKTLRSVHFGVVVVELGTLRSNDADGNENVKKTIGFISKTTILHVHHAFLYISLPVFARLRLEHA